MVKCNQLALITYIFVSFAGILVSGCTTGVQVTATPSPATFTEPTLSYSNATSGISFKYPASWDLQENVRLVNYNANVYVYHNTSKSNNNVNVVIGDFSQASPGHTTTLEELKSANVAVLTQLNVSDLTVEKTTLGGNDAYKCTYSMIMIGIPEKGVLEFTVKNNVEYIVTYTGVEETFDSDLPGAMLIFDTFTING